LSLTFAVERWFFFRRIDIDAAGFLAKMKQFLETGRFNEAIVLCDRTPGPIAAVAKTAIVNHQRTRQDLEELMEAARVRERLKLEKFLTILGTLGNTAPFIGLFGTVVGIIKAFRDLALSGVGGPAVVAKGIAEALVATAAGLAVAIPAVIVYNFYMRKVKAISASMEAASLEILVFLQPIVQ
jgi:biopolymer transport protein ExbB